jgi:hypothetical protein
MRALILAFVLAWSWSCGPATAASDIDDDTVAAAQALLRWQVSEHKIAASATHYYVSVDQHDLPPEIAAALKDTGIDFLPGSAYKAAAPMPHVSHDWIISIGKAKRQPNGDYQIDWGYYCGTLCASGNTAILHRDASGWHVAESQMHWVS